MDRNVENECADALQKWIELFEQGERGEKMLHATLDAEDALAEFRRSIEEDRS